ncbi:hypothetical protein ACFPRL_32180 [Pseudoclavibacter helvolus]
MTTLRRAPGRPLRPYRPHFAERRRRSVGVTNFRDEINGTRRKRSPCSVSSRKLVTARQRSVSRRARSLGRRSRSGCSQRALLR